MKWINLTRVFPLASVLKVVVPVVLAVYAFGVWTGIQWQSGRQAQATLAQREIDQQQADAATAQRQSAGVAYEQRRAERQRQRPIRDADLRAYLEARPDLWDCDIGSDGLRVIRSWDSAAAGADPAGAAQRLPDAAADAADRPGAGRTGDDEGPR